jgi:hypothetical protein
LIEDAEVHCFSCEPTDEDKVTGKKRKLRKVIDDKCEWIGKLKDAEAHYTQCQFAQTNCPHDGCDDIFVRKDLPGHIEDCIHRLSPCKWCSLGKKINLLDAHLLTCLERFVPCPNSCLDVDGAITHLHASEITHHRTLCLMELTECKFAVAGCTTQLLRKDMALHENDPGVHNRCFLNALQIAQAKIRELEQVTKAQAQAIEILKSNENTLLVSRVPISQLDGDVFSTTIMISGHYFHLLLRPNDAANVG